MCHDITATLPQTADLAVLMPLFKAHHMGCEPIANPHVAAQIPRGDKYILTTRGYCDCGTVLGSLHRADTSKENNLDRQTKKLRKQG